jgi:hypothetical protein
MVQEAGGRVQEAGCRVQEAVAAAAAADFFLLQQNSKIPISEKRTS